MNDIGTSSMLELRYRKRMQALAQEHYQRAISHEEYEERLKLIIDEFERALDYQNSEDTTLIPGTLAND